MMDIEVICECGKKMAKIEDGREESTTRFLPCFPKNGMEFVCECGKAVDIRWEEVEMEKVS